MYVCRHAQPLALTVLFFTRLPSPPRSHPRAAAGPPPTLRADAGRSSSLPRPLRIGGPLEDDDEASSSTPLPLGAAAAAADAAADRADRAALARELHTVSVAIAANATIFVAKMGAYAVTGSAAMLAEAVHSIVDTVNQALLRVGVVRSRRAPTATHPYGFMKDKFVWSLVSAVAIFCMGAGATVWHGVSTLIDCASGGAAAATVPTNLSVSAAVLAASAVVEGYSLYVAVRAVSAGAAAAGLPFKAYVARGSDPTSVAVMLEDGAAVAGLALAGAATAATAVTSNPAWDALGSVAVGGVLGVAAAFLISQNRALLLGRAMNVVDMQRVVTHVARDPCVAAVFDAKSEEIGPGVYRFKAEIEFDARAVVARALDRLGGAPAVADRVRRAVEAAERKRKVGATPATSLPSSSSDPLDSALDAYGAAMVGALGHEVDRLEASIRDFMPSIRHIDLEADRGRAAAGSRSGHSLLDAGWSDAAWPGVVEPAEWVVKEDK